MAVLNKIRQRSLVLILVIAMALFAFVIGDLFRNSDALTGSSQDVIATINGNDINRVEFQQKVKNYQDRFGGRQTSTQAMNVIYNQELRNIVLQTEYDALGLSVEKDEMRDLLKTNFSSYPEFQDENGVFDVNRLNGFIANLKDLNGQVAQLGTFQVSYNSWTTNEQAIASAAMLQSYYNMIKAGLATTVTEAENEHFGDSKTIDLSYVQVPYTTIADSLVEIKKSDVKAYIDAHKDQFEIEATRKFEFVEFKENPSKADEDAIIAELLKLKRDRPELNESSGNIETISGFDTTKDVAEFINLNSDLSFNDSFLRISELPASAKDSLTKLSVGSYFGPYKDGEFYKLSKLLETKQLPDSAKVRHILIPYVGANRADVTITQNRDAAKITADSILTVLKGNRSKFESLLDLSSDKVSNEQQGEIEFAYNSSFAPEFKAFSFDNKKGDLDVVETSFGFHIIEILDQTNFNNTYKIATLADMVEPSDKTLQDVFNDVSKFEIAAKDGDYDALAKERNLTIKPITVKELEENIPGLGSQREIVRWSFDEDVEVGDLKRFEVSGFGFIVARLVEKTNKGLMSVETASATALPEIRKEKKAILIREKLSGTDLNQIAKDQGQNLRTALAVSLNNSTLSGIGSEPMVVGTAFGLNVDSVSKPIDGNKGVYVVKVTKVNDATPLENYTPIMNRLSLAVKNSVPSKVFNALEKVAEIEDYRAKTVY